MTVISTVRQPHIAGIWGPAPDRKDLMDPGYAYRQPIVPKATEKPADKEPTVVQPEAPKPE